MQQNSRGNNHPSRSGLATAMMLIASRSLRRRGVSAGSVTLPRFIGHDKESCQIFHGRFGPYQLARSRRTRFSSSHYYATKLLRVTFLLFHVGLEPAENLWPAFVGIACNGSQTAVSYSHCGDAILFAEIEPDEGFCIVTLPAGVPAKFK